MAVTNVELLKLGLRIRAFRKVLGRNQKDFSKQCGLDRSYFGGVERGERNLIFFILCQICVGLNCDIAAVTEEFLTQSRSEVARIRATLYRIKTESPVAPQSGCVWQVPFTVTSGQVLQCEPATNYAQEQKVRSNILSSKSPLHSVMAELRY
jgi:transcriptional regulator with XRE-family HTH domain